MDYVFWYQHECISNLWVNNDLHLACRSYTEFPPGEEILDPLGEYTVPLGVVLVPLCENTLPLGVGDQFFAGFGIVQTAWL